jgi:hypothetical protein
VSSATGKGEAGVTWFKRYLWFHYHHLTGVRHWIARRITRTGWYLLCSFGILLLVTVDPEASVSYQGGVLLCVILAIAPLLTLGGRCRFEAKRILPRFASVGADLVYHVRVRNLTARRQRGLTVLEELPDPRPTLEQFSRIPEPGEERRNFWDRRYLYYRWRWLVKQSHSGEVEDGLCEDLEAHGEGVATLRLRPTRRGRLRLERIAFACPDPLGIFRAIRKVDCAAETLVLPRRYPVNALALPGIKKYQPGGVSMAGQVGESEEFVALRDYRPGDPLKKIHWRSTARCGRPIVKEFVDEYFTRHGLLLDTFTREPFNGAFEEAVSVAASFACTVRDRDSLLDLLVVGPVAFTFTAGRGVGQEEKMLEVLAGVQACSDRPFRDLENLVTAHEQELSGCLCVLLEWDEARQGFIRRLRTRRIPVKVILMVPAGRGEGIDPGVMGDRPEDFHVIPADRTAELLARLGPAGN